MIDVTGGEADCQVTVLTLEGPQNIRAGDFFLAKAVRGEICPCEKGKVEKNLVLAV
jgi:hypothetical protein